MACFFYTKRNRGFVYFWKCWRHQIPDCHGGITYKKLVLFECVIGTPRLVALASTFLLYKSRPVSTKAGPRTRERKEYWFTQARSSWQNLYRCKPTDNASENTYSICSLFLADKKMAWCISSIFSFQPADTLPKSLNHSPKSHQKSLIRADPFFPKNWRQKSPQIKQRSIQQHGQMEKRQTLSFTTEALGFSLFFLGLPEHWRIWTFLEPVLAYTSCI